jgi:hypothetical protein
MVKHDFFNTWTEFSAYVFGFWWADGCIYFLRSCNHNRRYKRFKISNTDKGIMEEIQNLLNSNLIKTRSKNKPIYDIVIHSDRLFDFCYRHVGSTRKSTSGSSLPDVPKSLFRHWLRGFFDGDGSICWKHYRNRHGKITAALQTSFTAGLESGEYLEQLRDKLAILGLGNKKIIYGKVSKKLVYNSYDSVKLCSLMYKDCNIALKRKREIWENVDIDRILAGAKFFSNKV